jgi:hypothetical protein
MGGYSGGIGVHWNSTAQDSGSEAAFGNISTKESRKWGCKPKPPKIPSSWVSGLCYLMEPTLVDVGIQGNVTRITQNLWVFCISPQKGSIQDFEPTRD